MTIDSGLTNEGKVDGSTRMVRLAEVRSFDPTYPNGASVAIDNAEFLPNGPAEGEVSAPSPASQDLKAEQPTPVGYDATGQPDTPGQSATVIRQAAQQIADSLLDTLADAVSDVRRRTEIDRPRLETAVESVQRLQADISRVNEELAALRQVTDSLAEAGLQQSSRTLALDDRLLLAEGASKQAQQQLESLTLAQTTTSGHLRASLDRVSDLETRLLGGLQRLDAIEQAIQALSVQVEQRGEMWERFLGSLRTLELRTEKRYATKEAVQVVVAGEPETAVKGHVTNVSENGLGLALEAAMAVGSGVQIEVDGTRLSGTVRHSRAQKGGYPVGVALTEPLRHPTAAAQ